MQQQVMISSRPQDAYRRQDILTANSVDLIVMLYDALKKNVILGRRGIEKKDMQMAHKHLMKAQDIVSELIKSLDMTYELSEELLSIYSYALRNLSEANMKKDSAPLMPVLDMINDLRSAWSEISGQIRGNMNWREELA
jgi:flagellar protein FliS